MNFHDKGDGRLMAESILNGRRILAVDDEPDVLDVLEEYIMEEETYLIM